MAEKTIKSPGLILGSDGYALGPTGLNGRHESNLSLMNMLKEQNKKAVDMARVMAAKLDGIKRVFTSFVQVTGPLLDEENLTPMDKAVEEFIGVMEEQLSVGSLAESVRK